MGAAAAVVAAGDGGGGDGGAGGRCCCCSDRQKSLPGESHWPASELRLRQQLRMALQTWGESCERSHPQRVEDSAQRAASTSSPDGQSPGSHCADAGADDVAAVAAAGCCEHYRCLSPSSGRPALSAGEQWRASVRWPKWETTASTRNRNEKWAMAVRGRHWPSMVVPERRSG